MAELGHLEPRHRHLVESGGCVAGDEVPDVVALQDADVAIVERLQSPTSCSQLTAGRTPFSHYDEVLPLPTTGDDSVVMLLTDNTDGVLSRVGYVVVRRGLDLMVVGYTNPGSLDSATLRLDIAAGLAKLQG